MGWVKLHREILEKAIWKCSTPEQKVVLMTIMMLANHKENQWIWKGEKYSCKPGQLITSLNSIAFHAGVSIKNVRTALDKFKKLDFLASEPASNGQLITICNWGRYQNNEDEPGKPQDIPPANDGQTSGKPPASNNKGRNKRTKKIKTEEETIIFNGLKSVFIENYRRLKNIEYYFTGKDAGQLELIYSKLKYLNKGSDKNIIEIWKHILTNINDKWVIENLSIPNVNSKFNEIVAKIRGNNYQYDIDEMLKHIHK